MKRVLFIMRAIIVLAALFGTLDWVESDEQDPGALLPMLIVYCAVIAYTLVVERHLK
jgi:hypothetical protein